MSMLNYSALQRSDLPSQEALPRACCVYFLLHHTEVVYVGQTRNLKQRFKQHHVSLDGVSSVQWVEIDCANLNEAEDAFIGLLQPRLNASDLHWAIPRCRNKSVILSVLAELGLAHTVVWLQRVVWSRNPLTCDPCDRITRATQPRVRALLCSGVPDAEGSRGIRADASGVADDSMDSRAPVRLYR